MCVDLRFAEPRSFLKKVLIVAVRRCHCGMLIRGLQNLEAPGKGTGLFFSRVRKEPKVHQRFANLWTPGTIQIAGRQGVFAKMDFLKPARKGLCKRKVFVREKASFADSS